MRVHTIPLNDLKVHPCSGACPCKPSTRYVEGGAVIIHNAWDGREFYEADADKARQFVFKNSADGTARCSLPAYQNDLNNRVGR